MAAPGKLTDIFFEREDKATEITMSWTPPNNSSCPVDYDISYAVLLKDMCDRPPYKSQTSAVGAQSSKEAFTISSLHPNSLYEICILGYNSAGNYTTCHNATTGVLGKLIQVY